jgi:hypothetical protein
MLKSNTALKAPEMEQGTAEDKSTKSVTIAQVRADAALFASQMGADIVDTIVETMDAAETVKRNPLLIMFKLEDRFDGKDGRRNLSDCPVPGSKTGNNPDHVEDKEKNAAGELKAVKTSFWREVAHSMEEGKAIKALLADVNGKVGRWEVGSEGAATEWRRVQEKKRLESRLGSLTTTVRKAASLYFQVQDIQALPHVEITFGTDVDGDGDTVLANVTSPVTIYDPKKPGTFETMSVGQFLQLDPKEAATNGGTYSALIKTLGREGGNGQGDVGGKIRPIKSLDDLLSMLDEIAVYLDQTTDEGKKHAAALAKAMANPNTGDDAVLSVCNAAEVLDAPSTRVRDRFMDIQNSVTANRQDKVA